VTEFNLTSAVSKTE